MPTGEERVLRQTGGIQEVCRSKSSQFAIPKREPIVEFFNYANVYLQTLGCLNSLEAESTGLDELHHYKDDLRPCFALPSRPEDSTDLSEKRPSVADRASINEPSAYFHSGAHHR